MESKILIPLKAKAKQERQTERKHQEKASSLYNYFSENQQQAARVSIDNSGRFYNVKNEPLSGLFLYVVLPNEQIICVEDNGKFFHSALANGKKVLASGKIQMENGMLTKVSNESGHYMPRDEEMRYMLSKFLVLSKNDNLIYESHCRAAEGIVQQNLVSNFLNGTNSTVKELGVNKYETTDIDDDHYQTSGVRSRFARIPKSKLEDDINKINANIDIKINYGFFAAVTTIANQNDKKAEKKEKEEKNACQKFCTIL